MDINDVKTNLEASDEGVFFPFGEDCEIKIAQWGNKEHKKFLRQVYAKHGRKIDAGAINDAQSDALMLPQWEHIVKDWTGITNDGEPMEFSVKLLMELASDKHYSAFFQKIASVAKEEENFRIQNIKEMGEALPTM
jgi:hypothetical protein|tara:strand:+ start:502 stop:909 length:408 start_codon:yes stop_codon:yes gene_type:complete